MAKWKDLARYEEELEARGVRRMPRMSYLNRLRAEYDRPLMDLSAGEINAWIGSLSASLSTHRSVVSHVKNALKFLNGGEMPRVCKHIVTRRGSQPSRVQVASELPTKEEIDKLIAATPRADIRALIALSVASGARPSELLRLRREDCILGDVKGSPVLRLSIRKTKTGKPRTVTVFDDRARHFFEEWRNGRDDGLLWDFKNSRAWWKALKALAKTAGLDRINWYPYLLRHTRGTELYDAPPAVRDAQMGWKPGSNMYANYTHLRPDQWEDALLEREGGTPDPVVERLAKAETFMRLMDEHPEAFEALGNILSDPLKLEMLRVHHS